MKIKKSGGGKYGVESSSKGKFYTVDLNAPSCTCAHFMFRLRNTGGKCKHIIAVEEKHGNGAKKTKRTSGEKSKIIGQIMKKGEVEAVVLMEQYGEQQVQELIDSGEIIESMGKLRISK